MIRSRLSPLILVILFGVVSGAVAGHGPVFQVGLTPLLIPKSNLTDPDQIVCFTQKWEAVDPGLYLEILELRKASPEAFNLVTDLHPNLCFNPERVPESERELLVRILNRIHSLSVENERRHDPLRNENKSLGRKVLRGSLLIQGTQLVGLGILLVLPESVTKWPDNPLASAQKNLKRAWTTAPVWDHDTWAINYIGHPYAGSLYYNALRSQGASPLASFIFSTAQSAFWEYVVEASAEQPSIQDLIYTSTLGSVLGEASHRATIGMGKNGFNTVEKITVIIINPTYVLNNGFKKRHAKPKPLF